MRCRESLSYLSCLPIPSVPSSPPPDLPSPRLSVPLLLFVLLSLPSVNGGHGQMQLNPYRCGSALQPSNQPPWYGYPPSRSAARRKRRGRGRVGGGLVLCRPAPSLPIRVTPQRRTVGRCMGTTLAQEQHSRIRPHVSGDALLRQTLPLRWPHRSEFSLRTLALALGGLP